MIDYEALILEAQDAREVYEDYCDCECERCPFAVQIPLRYFYEEPKYLCNISGEAREILEGMR